MKSRWYLHFALLYLLPVFSYSDVVVNELNYDPADSGEEGGALREFIELYNPGTAAVDLSGYAFTAGVLYTFPNGAKLNAGSYLVVVRTPTLAMWRRVSYPVYGPYEGKLSNGGEKLTLKKPDGTTVEKLDYNDKFPWPQGADGYGPSIERIAWDLPVDDFHSWRASMYDNGTPGAQNSVVGVPPRPMIRAYEISPSHPTSTDNVKVQIGVDAPSLISKATLRWETNAKSTAQGIVNYDDKWRIWKGKTAPSSALEWTSLSFNDSSWTETQGGFGYGDLDTVNTPLSDMQRNYISLYIRKHFTAANPAALGALTLNVFYDDGFVCYINGVEVARRYASDPYTNESAALASHESNESETIELGNASALLKSGDNVIALVGFNNSLSNSSDFVLSASLLSSAIVGGGKEIAMTFAGESVDGATYEAVIPAQTNQTLVRYNLQLELKDGKTLLLPYTTERRPYESYFVYDNDISSNLPILWLFANKVTHLPERSRAYSAVVVKATDEVGVQVYDGATITSARNGEKVKFIKGEEFREDRTINLSLESPIEGTTAGPRSPHVEHISYQLFRDFGVLSPRCDWYRVIENNTHSQRVAIQQPNEQFLKINGRDPDGNIYKIAYNEPGGYTKKTNTDEDDSDYRELFQHVNVGNKANLATDLPKYLAMDEIMGYELAMFLTSHWDGVKNNIFLYHDPNPDGKWEIIPWDVDKTFGYTDSDPMYWKMPIDFFITGIAPGSSELTGRDLNGPISRPFHSVPALQQEFVNLVAQALDGLFSQQRVGGMIDAAESMLNDDLDLIEKYTGQTDAARRRQIAQSYDTMRYFLENRHQFLRTQLPTVITASRTTPLSEYHSGETIQGIKFVVTPIGGKTISAKAVEKIPDNFTVSNIQTSSGAAAVSGNTIVWTLTNLSVEATLTYDLTAPSANPPVKVTLGGNVTVGDTTYSLADSELRYLPDNVASLGPNWVIGQAGTWTIVDGVLNCYADNSADPKHVWVNKDFGTGDYTVKADVRMIDWTDGDLARSGVAVRVSPMDSEKALNLLFHEDSNSVDLLYDLVAWGTNGDYAWKVGEWYTMILSVEGQNLEGQIQKTGSNEAPLIVMWSDSRLEIPSPGYPGLTGSTMSGLTTQFDNFEVIVNDKVVFSDHFDRSTIVRDWEMY